MENHQKLSETSMQIVKGAKKMEDKYTEFMEEQYEKGKNIGYDDDGNQIDLVDVNKILTRPFQSFFKKESK